MNLQWFFCCNTCGCYATVINIKWHIM